MLRSKYADPNVPTEVVLTFTNGGKEYRIRRNPEYMRLALRGTGETKQLADAELHCPDGRVITKVKDVNAAVREILGSGTCFGVQILPKTVEPMGIFIQPPGAFLVIAAFIAIMNAIGIKTRQRELVESNGCDHCCANCGASLTCPSKKAEGGESK